MNKHLVFVYGSLKQSHGNHRVVANAELLGTFHTRDKEYNMFSFGSFPGVYRVPEDDDVEGYCISGEVYAVNDDTLSSLDMLEGNGHFYTREPVVVSQGEDGAAHLCWMYLLPCREGRRDSHIQENDGVLTWNKPVFTRPFFAQSS